MTQETSVPVPSRDSTDSTSAASAASAAAAQPVYLIYSDTLARMHRVLFGSVLGLALTALIVFVVVASMLTIKTLLKQYNADTATAENINIVASGLLGAFVVPILVAYVRFMVGVAETSPATAAASQREDMLKAIAYPALKPSKPSLR